MSVERICQRDVDTARPEESVLQIAERMHQRTVGALVVVDKANVPVGIVTDRDLTLRVIAGQRDPSTTTIGDVMTRNPKTVSEMTEEYLAGRGGAAIVADIPLGRVTSTAEVAEAIRWLATDAPAASTGSVIDLNGASYVR